MTNTNQTNDETSEIERHLRSRVEELESTLEAMRAELRVAQQELWKQEKWDQ